MQIFLATCAKYILEGQRSRTLVTKRMPVASSFHSNGMRWEVKHRVWSCRGSLGSIQPKRSCSKWAGRETQAGLACSAHSFRRSADISWKLLTQIIVLSFWCFIICFLHCFSWLLFIFDQGHVSVNKHYNKSAFCSFSGFPNIYTPVPLPPSRLVPHLYLRFPNLYFITSPL